MHPKFKRKNILIDDHITNKQGIEGVVTAIHRDHIQVFIKVRIDGSFDGHRWDYHRYYAKWKQEDITNLDR